MSSEYSFLDIRINPESNNSTDKLLRTLFHDRLTRLQYNALKSRQTFLYTMRFFLGHHTNCEKYDEVKEELYEELETEGLDEEDEKNIKSVIHLIKLLYKQKK